jgi:hypothetical protein
MPPYLYAFGAVFGFLFNDGADLCYRGVFRQIGLIIHRRATWAGINSYPDGADLCYRGVFRHFGLIRHRRATWAGINSYPDDADLCYRGVLDILGLSDTVGPRGRFDYLW